MEKYVSFRIEKSTYMGAVNQASHDYRLHIPKYVDADRSKDNYEVYRSEEINSFSSWGKLHQDQKDRVKKLTGRTAQSNAQYFSKGIMTFSSTMMEDYKKSPDLFDTCAENFIKKLNEDLGLQCIYALNHLDEGTNIHIHLLFDNISKTTGKGIQRTIKPKDLTRAQDIMGECFEPMNYKRGESKSLTNAKHLRVSELHQLQELEKALGEDVEKMESFIDLYQKKAPALMMLLNILSSKREINFKSEKVINAVAVLKELTRPKAKVKGFKPKHR